MPQTAQTEPCSPLAYTRLYPGPPITGASTLGGGKSRVMPNQASVHASFILLAPREPSYNRFLHHQAAPPHGLGITTLGCSFRDSNSPHWGCKPSLALSLPSWMCPGAPLFSLLIHCRINPRHNLNYLV